MTGEATIRKDQIFSPEGIIEASEKQQRASLLRIVSSTCRAEGCEKKSRGGKSWKSCPCGAFKLCSKHKAGPLQCECIHSPPPLVNSSNSSDSVVPSIEATSPALLLAPTLPTLLPETSDSFQTCQDCQLLLIDGDVCHNCSYRGHSNPPPCDTESDDDTSNDLHDILQSPLPISFSFQVDQRPEVVDDDLQDDDVIESILPDDLVPQTSSQYSSGTCMACGFHTRSLFLGKCQRPACQSFTSSSKRPRRPAKRDFPY